MRKTIQMMELKNQIDLKKTLQALKPNATHTMDAVIVRETLRDLEKAIITIHDCFGVSVYKVDDVIYSYNKNINKLKNINGTEAEINVV